MTKTKLSYANLLSPIPAKDISNECDNSIDFPFNPIHASNSSVGITTCANHSIFPMVNVGVTGKVSYALWSLEDGITFVRELESKLAPLGYHCGLTGSVLYKGFSNKDLDVIIYPHDATKANDITFQKVSEMMVSDFNIEINKIDRLKYPDTKEVYWSN